MQLSIADGHITGGRTGEAWASAQLSFQGEPLHDAAETRKLPIPVEFTVRSAWRAYPRLAGWSALGSRPSQMAFDRCWVGEVKTSSMARSNSSAMRKASGREGSYLPVSMALTLWRETPSRSARSLWLQLRLGAQHLEAVVHQHAAVPMVSLIVDRADAQANEPEEGGAEAAVARRDQPVKFWRNSQIVTTVRRIPWRSGICRTMQQAMNSSGSSTSSRITPRRRRSSASREGWRGHRRPDPGHEHRVDALTAANKVTR